MSLPKKSGSSPASSVPKEKQTGAASRYVRIYLDVDMRDHLDVLMERTQGDMKETEVCQLLVRAALRAVAVGHYRLTVPMVFTMQEPPVWPPFRESAVELNDKPAGKK